MSVIAYCETQEEVDELWRKLSAGGAQGQCGWLQDKYGVPRQVVPRTLIEMLSHTNSAGSRRAVSALLTMKKPDIRALRPAYENA